MISPSNKSHLTTKAMDFLEVSHGPKGKPLPGGKRYKIHDTSPFSSSQTVNVYQAGYGGTVGSFNGHIFTGSIMAAR